MEPKVRGICPSCDKNMELLLSMEIPTLWSDPATEFSNYDEGEEDGKGHRCHSDRHA